MKEIGITEQKRHSSLFRLVVLGVIVTVVAPNKKMPSKSIFQEIGKTYMPAVFKKYSSIGYVIEYYALNPQTQEFQRFRIKLNKERKRFAKLADFKLYALNIANQINAKFAGGWSPLMESDNLRLYTKLEVVIQEFLNEKQRELRPDTMRSYNNFCKQFVEYLQKTLPNIYASLFNRVHAITYLDKIYKEKKLSEVSYNNRLKQLHALFEWAKEKCYVKENPFGQISRKREKPKKRILVDEETRSRLIAYLKENDPNFLLVCMLVYTSLIRPKEIRNIRIGDVSIKERCIYITSENAKNHNERRAALNQEIIDLLLDLHIERLPKTYYLVGGSMRPCGTQAANSIFIKHWDKMRKVLKLPIEMQLYSLRDTGINNMLKAGIDPLTVMQHADHHDLTMTTRYANHADPKLVQTIYEKAPKF